MKVKPTKFMSFIGLVFSLIFSIIGFTFVIPNSHGFGVVWTIGTLFVAAYYAINLFTTNGISLFKVDISDDKKNKK